MPTGGSTGLRNSFPGRITISTPISTIVPRFGSGDPVTSHWIATPVTHNMAVEVSMDPTFLTGGKVVMISSTRPKEILETIEKERVTTTILAVAQVQQILEFPELDRLRSLLSGGDRHRRICDAT